MEWQPIATAPKDPEGGIGMTRDKIAALMWKTQAVNVGAPGSIAAARTPDAFEHESEMTRATWLKQADAVIAALPDMIEPLVWDGRNDGSLITVCDTYEITRDGKHWKLCTCAFAGGYMGHSDKQSSLTVMANTHHRAAIMSAFGVAS